MKKHSQLKSSVFSMLNPLDVITEEGVYIVHKNGTADGLIHSFVYISKDEINETPHHSISVANNHLFNECRVFNSVINVAYNSVWDCGTLVTTPAKLSLMTGEVFEIETDDEASSEIDNNSMCVSEWIELTIYDKSIPELTVDTDGDKYDYVIDLSHLYVD